MKHAIRSSLIAACALACSHAFAGAVEVAWITPEKYADAGISDAEQKDNMRILGNYLQALGQKNLPPEQQLRIEVLDLDLAGTMKRSRRTALEHRVVRGRADWPTITLRYTLRDASGKVLRSGEERVEDMNYTRNLRTAGYRHTELDFEKYMLGHWFRQSFGPEQQALSR